MESAYVREDQRAGRPAYLHLTLEQRPEILVREARGGALPVPQDLLLQAPQMAPVGAAQIGERPVPRVDVVEVEEGLELLHEDVDVVIARVRIRPGVVLEHQ